MINMTRGRPLLALSLSCVLAVGCGKAVDEAPQASTWRQDETAFMDTLSHRTFDFFWDLADPHTGLIPDRAPTESFASVAATGFGLTAYPIGVERGWVTREAAAGRVLHTLRFLWEAPQHDGPTGAVGYKGFFYHFLQPSTGARFGTVELSTVDTALLLAGAFFCQSYFDGADALEDSIRTLTDALYERVDWPWASPRAPMIGHGWTPEHGYLPYDWRGYNEAMLVYLFALASPTHPVAPEAWDVWGAGYAWGTFEGRDYFGFGPLFGHQFVQVWLDLRGVRDDLCAEHDLDYFENSCRATLSQYDYARRNPSGFVGYGPDLWGLSACDGPVHGTYEIDGVERSFETYWARGASFRGVNDDGTVAPYAAGSSYPFASDLVGPLLMALVRDHGDDLFGRYGFFDALNPTFTLDVPVQHGRVVAGKGWYDTDYLGIDQGPLLAMIENRRSGLVWRTTKRNAHVVRGLKAAGFHGGWLDGEGTAP